PPSLPPMPNRLGDNADTAVPTQPAPPAARSLRATRALRATACAYSPRSQISKKGNGGRKIALTPARSLLRFGSGNFTLAESETKSAKTCSRGVRRPRTPLHALSTHAPTPRPVTRLAVQHATQSQAAPYAAKTLTRLFMPDMEMFVATRPSAPPRLQIFVR